ncbi:GTP cyclohydrolase I FolE [Enterococcus faecalis]|uniref:GTP cyclohydrolase 1 n=1 Tax=Enterococcus faecalis TaxID=1351 RepID=A0AAP6RII0_ENTFL|nr:GTP cyclohydrolase I FolE [Enterococcus faecalis]MXS30646.1 GTP cyclohydrolase I FolE [Enterococcus faecalis]MXS53504.1 GTP cyclohydrolase I FolE [Enterococcus faecalis]
MVEMEQEKQAQIEQAVTTILEAVGEDTQRSGLIDTPKRVAKMYAEVFSGLTEPEFDDYKLFDSLNEGEMVLVKDIAFYSMCEHHLLPFYGKVHVAYLPEGGKVLGLSKLPRLVEHCAKRPTVQEDLTVTIARKLQENIPIKGIAVAIEAEHMCMTMRGVKTPQSSTKTFQFTGLFKEQEWKNQFLMEIR